VRLPGLWARTLTVGLSRRTQSKWMQGGQGQGGFLASLEAVRRSFSALCPRLGRACSDAALSYPTHGKEGVHGDVRTLPSVVLSRMGVGGRFDWAEIDKLL
jgi:hypothetical protein